MVGNVLSFQSMLSKLEDYWISQGCNKLYSYDLEVGAGTLSPMTALMSVFKDQWKICYSQSCRRPGDSRTSKNLNRLQKYFQFQVLLKPCPSNLQTLYLQSLQAIDIDFQEFDIRFIEDDWENPSIGASGLGWEVWLNNMEISQYTYMQQIGGVTIPIVGELTYGLERLALYIQNVDNIFDLVWDETGVKYGDLYLEYEQEFGLYNSQIADVKILLQQFLDFEQEANKVIEQKLAFPAYDLALKCSHILNLLDARKVISVTERAKYLARIRSLVQKIILLKFKKEN